LVNYNGKGEKEYRYKDGISEKFSSIASMKKKAKGGDRKSLKRVGRINNYTR
jgi:hypothetical protein